MKSEKWKKEKMILERDEDIEKHNFNLGKNICPNCEGTGNACIIIYCKCERCDGTGVIK